MRIEDLVVLLGPDNGVVPRLVEIKDAPKDLKINVDTGEWSDKSFMGWIITGKIGEGCNRLPVNHRVGVIGVYDRTNFKHLESLVYAVFDSVRQMYRPLGGDDF